MELVRKKLSAQLKEFICEEIAAGKYPPGERIATVRALARQFQVGHTTAAATVRELVETGILTAHAGGGARVAGKLPWHLNANGKRNRVLYFLHCNTATISPYHNDVLAVLRRGAEACNWSVREAPFSESALQHAQSDRNAVGIVHATSEASMPSGPVPVVCYGMRSDRRNPTVTPDNFRGGYSAGVLYSRSRCYKSARFITGAGEQLEWMEHFNERYHGCAAALAACGISLPPPLPWNRRLNRCSEVERLLQKLRNGELPSPILLFVANRAMAVEISLLAQSLKLKIPEELSIVTFIRRSGMESHLPLDTYDFNHVEMGEALIRLLKWADEGAPLPSRLLLPMTLFPQGSTISDKQSDSLPAPEEKNRDVENSVSSRKT